MMNEKQEIFKHIDPNYLSQFILNFNNTPRYEIFQKNKDEIIKYMSRKFKTTEANEILKGFLFGTSPEELGKKLKERNGKELADIFIGKLGSVPFRKEFTVNNRICDLAYLDRDGNIHALEIKANGDKIDNAVKQCKDYSKWANYVCLLIEKKKEEELKKIKLDKFIGIIVFDGNFKTFKKASYIEHNINDYVNLLTNKGLKELSRKFHIKLSGRKDEIRKRILFKLKDTKVLSKNTPLKESKFILLKT